MGNIFELLSQSKQQWINKLIKNIIIDIKIKKTMVKNTLPIGIWEYKNILNDWFYPYYLKSLLFETLSIINIFYVFKYFFLKIHLKDY